MLSRENVLTMALWKQVQSIWKKFYSKKEDKSGLQMKSLNPKYVVPSNNKNKWNFYLSKVYVFQQK